jgi:hypothetical protein
MKVSITEDATIRRTRLGGGTPVVREEAIARRASAAAGIQNIRKARTTAALR